MRVAAQRSAETKARVAAARLESVVVASERARTSLAVRRHYVTSDVATEQAPGRPAGRQAAVCLSVCHAPPPSTPLHAQAQNTATNRETLNDSALLRCATRLTSTAQQCAERSVCERRIKHSRAGQLMSLKRLMNVKHKQTAV